MEGISAVYKRFKQTVNSTTGPLSISYALVICVICD